MHFANILIPQPMCTLLLEIENAFLTKTSEEEYIGNSSLWFSIYGFIKPETEKDLSIPARPLPTTIGDYIGDIDQGEV